MTRSAKVDFARIWPIQAGAATLLLAGALHFTLTPAYAQAAGFSPAQLGMIGSAYYVGFLMGSLLNPLVFRELGHRRLFALYALIIALAVGLQPILTGPIAWFLLRAAVGFLAAGMFAALESWLNAVASNANRGRTLSAYSMSNQVALAGGQFLFTLTPVEGGVGFYISAAILLATMAPFSAMAGSPPPAPAQRRIRLAALSRASPVAFAGFVANGLATAPFWVLGPVFARDNGFDQGDIALFMALPVFGSFAAQWPVARLSDGMDRRLVILPVVTMAMLAAIGVALASGTGPGWRIYTLAVLFGGSAFLVNMLSSAHMNDRVPHADLTEAAGASFLAYGAASVIGPLTASAAMGWLGPAGLFWHAALILGCFALFTLTRLMIREPVTPAGDEV
ncbi:MAG: MFS transporter [Micropepsaceae bacterium]